MPGLKLVLPCLQDEFPEPGDEKTAADVQQYVVPEDNLVWQAAMQALRPYQQRGICELVHHFRTAGKPLHSTD